MSTLTVDNLSDILNKVHEVRSKWYLLGLQLNVDVNDLDSIKQEGEDCICMCHMLKHWLKSDSATMKALIEALQSQIVGEKALAKQLSDRESSTTATANKTGDNNTSDIPQKKPVKRPAGPNKPPEPKRTKTSEKATHSRAVEHETTSLKKSKGHKKTIQHPPESLQQDLFVRSPETDRLCVKCKRVPLNPQRSLCCNRLYCKPCANKTKKCSKRDHTETIKYEAYKDLHSKIQKLKVKCLNWEAGCEHKCEVYNLKNHLPNCSYFKRKQVNSNTNAASSNTSKLTAKKDKVQSAGTASAVAATPHQVQASENNTNSDVTPNTFQTTLETVPLLTSVSIIGTNHDNFMHDKREDTNQTPPINLAMSQVQEIRAKNIWVSHSFLSHQLGYKICLAVQITTDNNVQVGIILANSDQNSFLKFPCSGQAVVKILSPVQISEYMECKVPFILQNASTLQPQLISMPEPISDDFIKENHLFFKVSKIYVDNDCYPWVLEPTLTIE